jgi:hypothetical protein
MTQPKEQAVKILSSADGTKIAYDQQGAGQPALILVDGAMCSRSSGSKPELVSLLAAHFTVYSYDPGAAAIAGIPSPTRSSGRSKMSRP